MKLIKSILQLIEDIKQVINDPYSCMTEEGKKEWQELENEMPQECEK